jgi:hypothetical protein
MKLTRPGTLSVRTVSQYRRREVLSYLGLRYYLDNAAARTDQWAREVAVDLTLTRDKAPLFEAHHFKEVAESGVIKHRSLFLPGPNEALAEATLLAECARHPRVFRNPPCVFSYTLSQGNDRSGIFAHYIGGLKDRHDEIARACDAVPDGVVRYTDIKNFYPSVPLALAGKTWRYWAERAGLDERFRHLGDALIEGQMSADFNPERTLLIGPMFSHVLANLVLRKLDEDLSLILRVQYVRYVDDITLIGEANSVSKSLQIIGEHLAGELGFRLHDDSSDKCLEVPAQEWLKGRDDFYQNPHVVSWMTLIADLKRFLILHPEEQATLKGAFREEGFRIPIRDYSNAVFERSFLERLGQLAKRNWFRRSAQNVSITSLLENARLLRDRYLERFEQLLDQTIDSSGYDRKRAIPKLRYRAGRLVYLASEDVLSSLAKSAKAIPELHLLTEVMEAVSSSNLDRILPLGTNAAQAAAQPIRAAKKTCLTTLRDLNEAEQQSLGVFLLNGVSVDRQGPDDDTELMRFAKSGADPNLMKSGEPFMRELACLHGLAERPRHPGLLETAYDEDEDLALDAIDQLQQSLSM